MTGSGKALPLAERWALDEEMLADAPLQVDAQPRWITDHLSQYGLDSKPQPLPDKLSGDDL